MSAENDALTQFVSHVVETRWTDEVGQWTASGAAGMPLGVRVVRVCEETGRVLVSYVESVRGGVSCSGPDYADCLWHMTCAAIRYIAGKRGADCWPEWDGR